MKFPRTTGLLLHPTSLPSPHGIGDLGPVARQFIDWMANARFGVWQVLPLGPTGYGDSPYQCFSAFAGNPLLISLDDLAADGWLLASDLASLPRFPRRDCDFGAAYDAKLPLLQRAAARFDQVASDTARAEFSAFCSAQASWLDDYALFRACKAQHEQQSWTQWAPDIRDRAPEAMTRWRTECAAEIHVEQFVQWQYAVQWKRLHERCAAAGIAVMGDVPIFVAHDSADVWANPSQFRLNADGTPTVIAGVPPDYFSATGQCWGNPLYAWDAMAADGYAWWIKRFKHLFTMVDWARIDHFRGFEAFWEIPGGETTAVNGQWVTAPGDALFTALRAALGALPIIAENLGEITPAVEELREKHGFPGMAILQFAFGGDAQAGTFIPHNYVRDLVAYTGSHDNDTLVGWWNSGAGDSTRTEEMVAREKDFARRYMRTDGHEIHWDVIRTLMASVANIAIIPMQDILGAGSEARMNVPGRMGGNWLWRFGPGEVTRVHAERLREYAGLYGRLPRPTTTSYTTAS
jgi:4-alpha-glucanotransferase